MKVLFPKFFTAIALVHFASGTVSAATERFQASDLRVAAVEALTTYLPKDTFVGETEIWFQDSMRPIASPDGSLLYKDESAFIVVANAPELPLPAGFRPALYLNSDGSFEFALASLNSKGYVKASTHRLILGLADYAYESLAQEITQKISASAPRATFAKRKGALVVDFSATPQRTRLELYKELSAFPLEFVEFDTQARTGGSRIGPMQKLVTQTVDFESLRTQATRGAHEQNALRYGKDQKTVSSLSEAIEQLLQHGGNDGDCPTLFTNTAGEHSSSRYISNTLERSTDPLGYVTIPELTEKTSILEDQALQFLLERGLVDKLAHNDFESSFMSSGWDWRLVATRSTRTSQRYLVLAKVQWIFDEDSKLKTYNNSSDQIEVIVAPGSKDLPTLMTFEERFGIPKRALVEIANPNYGGTENAQYVAELFGKSALDALKAYLANLLYSGLDAFVVPGEKLPEDPVTTRKWRLVDASYSLRRGSPAEILDIYAYQLDKQFDVYFRGAVQSLTSKGQIGAQVAPWNASLAKVLKIDRM